MFKSIDAKKSNKKLSHKNIIKKDGVILKSRYRVEPIYPRHHIDSPHGYLHLDTHYDADYHGYTNSAMITARPHPILPRNNLSNLEGKSQNTTTYNTSFQLWLKALETLEPIIYKENTEPNQSKWDTKSTFKKDYDESHEKTRKIVKKNELKNIPCVSKPKRNFGKEASFECSKINNAYPAKNYKSKRSTDQFFYKPVAYEKSYSDVVINKTGRINHVSCEAVCSPCSISNSGGSFTQNHENFEWRNMKELPEMQSDTEETMFPTLIDKDQFSETDSWSKPIAAYTPCKNNLYFKSFHKKDFPNLNFANEEISKNSKEKYNLRPSKLTREKSLKEKRVNKVLRVKPIMPKPNIDKQDGKFYGGTTYGKVYQDSQQTCPVQPIYPSPYLKRLDGQFYGETSYGKAFHDWVAALE